MGHPERYKLVDYYSILNVDKSASAEDIKKAFRKLSMEHHPDKNGGSKESEDKFKQINEAYSILSDPDKRQAYDNPAPAGNPLEDLFRGFNFGFDFRNPNNMRNMPIPGDDIVLNLNIPIIRCILGGTFKVATKFEDICKDCSGKGFKTSKVCPQCNGSGMITNMGFHNGIHMRSTNPCPNCRTTGEVGVEHCDICNSKGTTSVSRSAEVNVKAGSRDREHIIIEGQGRSGINGGNNGNLVIRLNVIMPDASKFTPEQKDTLEVLLG